MQLYIVDAFTDHIFGGNQAGVVLLREEQPFPDDRLMQKIAAELKHSETAFVTQLDHHNFQLRYFTPEGEVELCGHATVSTFTVLREQGQIACSDFVALTLSGNLSVSVEPDKIWLEMPQGELAQTLSEDEAARAYAAYGLNGSDRVGNMQPTIVKVGLADILLPVNSKTALDHAMQNRDEVIAFTRELGSVGVHMFFLPADGEPTAYCRNFAPLFGIDEEAATGTSNASLTYYLLLQGRVQPNNTNTFVQGEAIGKPSTILSKVDEHSKIWIGGNAVISVQGTLKTFINERSC